MDQLVTFSVVWAFAALCRQFTALAPPGPGLFVQLVVVACALSVLEKPYRTRRLFYLSGAELLAAAADLPWHLEATVLAVAVNATVLIAAVLYSHRDQPGDELTTSARRRALGEALRRPLTLIMCAAAVATVFPKLNPAYFDLHESCANAPLDGVRRYLPIPDVPVLQALSVYGTVAAECLVPVLVVVRRTRFIGMGLGLLVYGALGLAPALGAYAWAATYAGVFAGQMSPAVAVDAAETAREAARRVRSPGMAPVLAGLVLVGLGGAYVLRGAFGVFVAWYPFFVVGYALFGWTLFDLWRRGLSDHRRRPAAPRRWPLWLPAGLVLVHVALPHLGVKTVGTFCRYSNLRTDPVAPNHWLVSPHDVLGLHRDAVRVLGTNIDALEPVQTSGARLPRVELRRRFNAARPPHGGFVHFEDAAGSYRATLDQRPVAALPPLSWWESAGVLFAPYPDGPGTRCPR